MFYVYLLESGGQRYIGNTINLRRRLEEHNTGQNRSTKRYMPWRLIYYEAHLNQEDARRREKYFKGSVGRRSLNRMLHSYNQSVSNDFGNQRSTSGKAQTAKPTK